MGIKVIPVSMAIETFTKIARSFLCVALALGAAGEVALLKGQAPGGEQTPASSVALSATPSAPSALPVSDTYLICPDDVLDVFVYDVPELSHTYTVSSSGAVSVPLLPAPLQAAGLTPDQFARSLEKAFRDSGRLKRPEIAVALRQSRSLTVTVDGAVKNPLVLTVTAPSRLVDILTQCGGVSEDAGTTLTITRGPAALRDLAAEGGVASPTLTVDLRKLGDGSDPASKVAVWPGDRVSVERAGVFYVLGEVKLPGGYTLKSGRDELTVLRAIALAGDMTGVAKRNKAMIIRKDAKAPQGRQEIKLDLPGILAGRSPDPLLEANDILFIPGSTGKKALRGLAGVPQTALGQAGAAALIIH